MVIAQLFISIGNLKCSTGEYSRACILFMGGIRVKTIFQQPEQGLFVFHSSKTALTAKIPLNLTIF